MCGLDWSGLEWSGVECNENCAVTQSDTQVQGTHGDLSQASKARALTTKRVAALALDLEVAICVLTTCSWRSQALQDTDAGCVRRARGREGESPSSLDVDVYNCGSTLAHEGIQVLQGTIDRLDMDKTDTEGR